MSGGSILFYLGTYCYMTDITTEENRTFRMAIVDGLIWIGFYIGNILAGPIKTNMGLKYNFIISLIFILVAFLYTLFFVKESLNKKKSESNGKH